MQKHCTHGFVGAPSQFCGDVHTEARVGHAQISLQGDARRGSVTDDGHQLLALLEPLLLSNVHLPIRQSRFKIMEQL